MSPSYFVHRPPLVPYSMCALSMQSKLQKQSHAFDQGRAAAVPHPAAGQKALRNSHPLQALPIYIGIPLTYTPQLFPESPSFLPDLETTVVDQLPGNERKLFLGVCELELLFSCHSDCPERPLGVGGGNQLSPRSSQFPSQFHPSPVKIHLLQEALRLDGARLPSRGLQASHTADYLLHFHLSAVVLCLSFLVSDFPSLFYIFHQTEGHLRTKTPKCLYSRSPTFCNIQSGLSCRHFVGSLCRLVSRICAERGTAGKPRVFRDSGPP